MKRFMLFGLLLIAYAGMVFGASIRVTQPDGSVDLTLQQNFNIQWTASGLTSKINLILFKDGARVGVIVRDLDKNATSFSWRVGDYVGGRVTSRGTGYQIKVKDQGATTFGDSSRFTLVPPTDGGPVVPGRAELSIMQITRRGSDELRPGDTLSLAVKVANRSDAAADICIATIGTADENFVRRGSPLHIEGQSAQEYDFDFTVDRSRIRGGYFESTIFLVDANAPGRTIFEVMYKDGNIGDHNKPIRFKANPGLLTHNAPIARAMTSDWANFWVPAPTFAFCSAARLPSLLERPASGQILMGYEEIFAQGAPPFPCHKRTRHRFWGAVAFNLESIPYPAARVRKAILQFSRTPARASTEVQNWNAAGLAPEFSVKASTADWTPGFHVVNNPSGTPQPGGVLVGRLAEGTVIDVTPTVLAWISGRLENRGFAFTQDLPALGAMTGPHRFGAYIYSFELIITWERVD